MYKAEEISGYEFKPADRLLLDANVWLFIYGPHKPGDEKVAVYSHALARIKAAQSCIYIDVLIVSEFINRLSRLKWKQNFSKYGDFKQFRKSKDFKSVARNIAADVKYVLGLCTRVSSGFESLEINRLIDKYSEGNADFNDQVLSDLCNRTGMKLVTDDSDFKGRDIPIITANHKLLV